VGVAVGIGVASRLGDGVAEGVVDDVGSRRPPG